MKKGRKRELFKNSSSLEQFIAKYGKQFEALTAIEIEVLRLLAKEVSSAAICKELVLSPDDLINKEINIKKKLSISSQTDYVKYALAFGLIPF